VLIDPRGEGFISLIKGFNNAISGLSTDNTETYGQVVVGGYLLFRFELHSLW
jgi:hypothetical protein